MPTTFKLIEAEVEALIVAALQAKLAAAGLAQIPVVGFLTPFAEGTVKESGRTAFGVTVNPRFNVSLGSCQTNLRGEVALAVSRADSPDGALVAQAEACALELLQGWSDEVSAANAALSVENVFGCDGFLFLEGGQRDFDGASQCYIVSAPFRIPGRVLNQQTTP